MEIRELHEIATMYTNIGEAISFVNEHKKPKDINISLTEIQPHYDGKGVVICLMYEYGDFEHTQIFWSDVDYRRSTLINDIMDDIAKFVKECGNE